MALKELRHTEDPWSGIQFVSPKGDARLRLALHVNALNTNRKSGVAFPLLILRLDERLWVEICVHTVMQKCVKSDVVCVPGG